MLLLFAQLDGVEWASETRVSKLRTVSTITIAIDGGRRSEEAKEARVLGDN